MISTDVLPLLLMWVPAWKWLEMVSSTCAKLHPLGQSTFVEKNLDPSRREPEPETEAEPEPEPEPEREREQQRDDVSMDMKLAKRIAEALLFAAEEPLDLHTIQAHIPGGLHARDVIDRLMEDYEERGVRLELHGNRYAIRTAPDIAPYLQRETVQSRRLSRAALETLAIIAYHQPITRAEIEEVRGVSTNKGTLDLLLETGWVQPKGRRETPGRPVTWVTTGDFLDHLDLGNLDDLPRIEELMQVGLLGSPGALRGDVPEDEPEDEQQDEPAEGLADESAEDFADESEEGSAYEPAEDLANESAEGLADEPAEGLPDEPAEKNPVEFLGPIASVDESGKT